MAWTYSGNPGASDRDLVRFLIGDTDSTDEQLSDAEVDYLLTAWTYPYGAAIAACSNLAATYSRMVDTSKKVGDLSLTKSYGARQAQYAGLAAQLRAQRTALYPPTPVVNADSLLPTDQRSNDSEGSDFVVGAMDNVG
jgi:hypothetical protein